MVKINSLRGKKGAIGESIMMIYRMLLVVIIAFFILGIGAFVYDYYLNVRDAEAILLARDVVNCIAPRGEVSLETMDFLEKNQNNFIEAYCNISGAGKFYINLNVGTKDRSLSLEEGESNTAWTKGIFQDEKLTAGIRKYKPGILEPSVFPIIVNGTEGKITLEVVVNPEF